MKKVKMFLIAFSLLTCSSFAFATKLDEEEKELFKKSKEISFKNAVFEGESGIDFSQLQEDLKDFMNGQYFYYVKNPYETKNYELKPVHLSDLKKKIVKSIRNFYKNREFLFLTKNKIEAKDEFLCCEKYFIKKDEINNLKNDKEIKPVRIGFFYKEDKIYAKKLNQKKSFEISTNDVEEKVKKEKEKIEKLKNYLTNNNFVKNGKIDEIKEEKKFMYSEFGKNGVEVFYEKNLNSFLKEKIDKFEKNKIKSFNLVDNEQNLYEIKIKNDFEFEKKLLLESFKKGNDSNNSNIFKNLTDNQKEDLYWQLYYSLEECLPGSKNEHLLTKFNGKESKITYSEFENIKKRIYEEIEKNPDECYHKIELENFVNKNKTDKSEMNNKYFNKTKINRLTFHCFLFKDNQNNFKFKLYLNKEKNEFKEDNFYYKDYDSDLDSPYEHFKINEKEFDEILTKENLLKDGKIEIFDVEKNKTISLTLDQFKILAKQTVLFFETKGPKIENIIKKNEHKNEEGEFLVNLHLDYDPENKTIKIKNIVNSKNKIKKFLKEQLNFNDLQSPGFIMPDVLYVTKASIVQNCHNTSDKEEQIETLDDNSNEEYKEKIENIKFNEEEKNLLNIFFERNSSTYKSTEKNEREEFLEDFLTNLNERFKNEFYSDLFYGSDTNKVNQKEKNFQYFYDVQSQNELKSTNPKIKVLKIKLKATNCDVEKIKDEYKNKGKLFKYSTYKEVFKLEIEIKDEEKNETIFLKNRFIAPKIYFEREFLIKDNLYFKAAFQKNPQKKDKEKIVYDYEKLNEAADAIEDAFTEEINNKKDGFRNTVTKIFPDYNIKLKIIIAKYGNIIYYTPINFRIFDLTEEEKKAFIKIKKYNLNFFKEKDKNKLKDLKIAENEEDLELIKNEIVNKLKEKDLIKLKKITLAGKTPYAIPLKLEIKYNNENEKAKYFKLEIYYSVSLKEFKAKNIKTITKEEYEKKEEK